MRGFRDFGNALVAATLSVGLVLGALSISLVNFLPEAAPEPTQALIVSPVPVTATNTFPPTLTPLASADTPTSTATNIIPPPISCPPPTGWVAINIQAGETLESIALKYNINSATLRSVNCLSADTLIPGTLLFVPGGVPTRTVAVCVQGASGWIKNYSVKSGDTFFNIGSRYGVSVNTIKNVNCRSSDRIYVGEIIWVPNVPTRTPTFTPLPGVTYTVVPELTQPFTETVLPFTLTPIPTQTPIPATSTEVPTATPIPTHTASPTAFP
jgi:LysM repeat protein